MPEMEKYYPESKRKGISYRPYTEGRLKGMVTYCAGNCLIKYVIEGKVEGRSDEKTSKKRYAPIG